MNSTIQFKMEEPDIELQEKTVQVEYFHTRKVKKTGGSLKFSIPMEITRELNIKKGSVVYYAVLSSGIYLYFDVLPVDINQKFLRDRKVSTEGQYGTKYVAIPPMVKLLTNKEIVAVALLHTKGDPSYIWQLQPLTTDSISENSSENI